MLQDRLELEDDEIDEDDKEDLMVPGFKRTIEYCVDKS
jgi:hypothetical protein